MRVLFTNLGCKLNQAEIERFGREFVAAGHQFAASLDDADLHVVNSCTVTHAASRASRKAARQGRRRSQAGAGGRVRTVLTGCYATAEEAAAAALAGVDLVISNRDKDRLLEKVHAAFPELAPRTAAALLPARHLSAQPPADGALFAGSHDSHTRALLKVEDGCDMRCAFCIIPLTRGRQRSRPLEEVLTEARLLARRGHREIVATGVQISAWRDGQSSRLPHLIGALLAALPPQGVRLRLTSIAPWQVDARLLAAWSDRRLCRHLHLSMQSGSTATLRRMRRPYSAASFARLLAGVRVAIPGVAVTTDVIVGFPGESAAEFEESLLAVAAMGFAKVHVFPFSPRQGTVAAALPAAVAADERRERMARMLALAEASERDFWRAHLGARENVLWERPKAGRGHGLTDNYIRVWSAEAAGFWNRFTDVDLVDLAPDGSGVTGRLVPPEPAQ